MDQVFLSAFNGELIVIERRKKKYSKIDKKTKTCCISVNNFSPPVACQSAAGQTIIFPPKINACVLCVKTQKSLYEVFLVLAKTHLI